MNEGFDKKASAHERRSFWGTYRISNLSSVTLRKNLFSCRSDLFIGALHHPPGLSKNADMCSASSYMPNFSKYASWAHIAYLKRFGMHKKEELRMAKLLAKPGGWWSNRDPKVKRARQQLRRFHDQVIEGKFNIQHIPNKDLR